MLKAENAKSNSKTLPEKKLHLKVRSWPFAILLKNSAMS